MRGISFTLLLMLSSYVLLQTLWIIKEAFHNISNKKSRWYIIFGILLLNILPLACIWFYFYDPQKIRVAVNYSPYYYISGIAVLIYTPQLVYSIFSIGALAIRRKKKGGFCLRTSGSILSIVTFLYLLHGMTIDPYKLRVINLSVKAEIPEEFDGYRIVQVSDVHLAFF